jgi:acetate kinase
VTDAILTLNIGSSSIKCALYEADRPALRIMRAEISGTGDRPAFRYLRGQDGTDPVSTTGVEFPSGHEALIGWIFDWIAAKFPSLTIVAVGHRIVHGGREFAAPAILTRSVLEALDALSPLALGHQPFNLAGVRIAAERWPEIPQVGCFDTAFHRAQPRIAQLYGLPRALADDGIIRFGFHGLSYQYIAGALLEHAGARADGRVIVAHLGHGASMCAMLGGKSQATSMGFTALDGLVMGRRCGDLDPGVVLHLLRARNMSADDIENLLSRQSGLFGVSGLSDDMRTLLQSDDPRAKEAVDLFTYRAARAIGSLAAAIGGLDVLVFTGGIGENSATIRERIMSACSWLGVKADDSKNQNNNTRISAEGGAADLFVIPTDEEAVIAQSVFGLLSAPPGGDSPVSK